MAMILDGDLRDEFLCTPELVRAVLTDDNQLALAVKASLSQLEVSYCYREHFADSRFA